MPARPRMAASVQFDMASWRGVEIAPAQGRGHIAAECVIVGTYACVDAESAVGDDDDGERGIVEADGCRELASRASVNPTSGAARSISVAKRRMRSDAAVGDLQAREGPFVTLSSTDPSDASAEARVDRSGFEGRVDWRTPGAP